MSFYYAIGLRLDLRHIRYFVAVAEELNFTRAAARIGIGQPPLSQQIADLEEELGVMLLRRVPHGAELTEAGTIFLKKGRQVLAAAESAAAAVKGTARGEHGRLRLGFTSSAHFNGLVPSMIRQFSEEYPEVELQLVEANTRKLAQDIACGTVDLAFTHDSQQEDSGLEMLLVAVEPLVAALAREHVGARDPNFELSFLSNDMFILKPRDAGPQLYQAVLSACRRAGFEPRLGQEAPQLATIISIVAAGLGVSLVPASMKQIANPLLIFRALDDAEAHVRLVLIRQRHEPSETVENFVMIAKGHAQPVLSNARGVGI